MEDLFLKVLNLSISAAWVVLAVVVLRFALQKAPKWVRVALWSVVGLRLVWPFSIESILSLIPSAQTVPPDIGMARVPAVETGVPVLNASINPVLGQTMAATPQYSANPMQVWQAVAALVWVGGMVLLALYALISWLVVRLRVREAARERENVWVCDRVGSPFILGIVFPRIYLPSDMAEADMPFVLAHERAHLKRKDHWWKPLGFALLTVHWFNPAVWLAYILLCRDIELACDEKVLSQLGEEGKKSYCQALIHCSAPRRMITACPVAFGETGVKGRIKSVLHYKKPAFWVILVAVIVCIAVAVCFLTDPKQPAQEADMTQLPTLRLTEPTGNSVEAVRLSYDWLRPGSDGEERVSEAISLTSPDSLPLLEMLPIIYSHTKGNTVTLDFTVMPESVTVSAQPVEQTEDADPFYMRWTKDGAALPTFDALEGTHVYTVTAQWEGYGTCTYAFRARVNTLQFGYVPSEPILTQPPTLWITDGAGQTVQAVIGNRKWHAIVDGKLVRDEKTDVALEDIRERLPVMEVKPGLDDFTYGDTYLLQFTQAPDKLSVTATGFDSGNSHRGEETANVSTLEPETGKYIYTIHAVWLQHGQVEYSFISDVLIPEYEDLQDPLPSLQSRYPQYFGLDPRAGMTVYVWQEAFNDYRCILLPDPAGRPTDAQLLQLRSQALSMQSMRAILWSYGVNMAEVPVVPVQLPGSAYTYALTDAYQSSIRVKLWDTRRNYWARDPHWQIDVAASKVVNGKVTVTLLNHGVNQRGVMRLEYCVLLPKENGQSLERISEKNGQQSPWVTMEVELPVGEKVTLVLDVTEEYGDIPKGEYMLSFSVYDRLKNDEDHYPYDRMYIWGYIADITIE